jgi:FG-GAP-like repeat/FG-GAP repeat
MMSTKSKYIVRILMTQVLPILVLSGLLQSQSVAQSASFIARRDFVPGGSVVTAADMNSDGKADLIVSNTSTSTLSVLLGKGDGTFQPALVTNFPSGQVPAFVEIADINVDGKPDLVTLTQFSGTGSVMLGIGNGGFQLPINFPVDFQSAGIAVGDFNGDGRPDVAVTSSSFPSGSVSVSLGNGNGTFGPRQIFPVGNSPASVALGDLNGDGKLDVAVANTGSSSLSVLLGNGNGTLLPAPNIAVDSTPRSLTINDFDGDQKPDLAVVLQNLDEISILAGNGDGTFLFPLNVAVSQSPVFMMSTDFNGDQIPDLVVAHSSQFSGGGSVSMLLGIGDGSFQAPTSYALNGSPSMLAVSDFNADGFRDVVVSQPSLSFSSLSNISEFFGTGDGTLQSAAKINVLAPTFVVVMDFDGNGILDFAVDSGSFPRVLSIFTGNGDGTFRAGTIIALNFSSSNTPPVAGDFNNDSIPDLAVASFSIVAVLLGNGDGSFQAPRTFNTNITPSSLVVSDFNSDGKMDLAAGGSSGVPGTVMILLGIGNGTFETPKSFTTANTISALATGEFNGDGLPDLVTASSNTNNVSVFLGIGDGTFSPLSDIPVGRGPIFVTVGDLNGDGFADIGTANSSSSNVSILFGNGHGGFQAAFNFTVAGNPSSLTFGDFNKDKRMDLAVTNTGANTVSVLLNAGGAFIAIADEAEPNIVVRTAPAAFFGVGTNPAGLVAGDFNGDLLPDLVTVDRGSNGLSVLINNTKITP